MKKLRLLLGVLFLHACVSPGFAADTVATAKAAYVPYQPDLPAGTACMIDARALHPTQFSLGLREVRYKAKVIGAKTPDALATYLMKKDVPIVIGPGGVPYMTDGHHTIRALLDSAQPDKTVYGHILANWSALTPAGFWAKMQADKNTYLRDAAGRGPLSPDELPATLADMQSDPCRGLAWAVMQAGGFAEQKGVFFQEFYWADFFRDKITWDDTDEADFARATQAAVTLARSPAATGLPGYIPAPAAP